MSVSFWKNYGPPPPKNGPGDGGPGGQDSWVPGGHQVHHATWPLHHLVLGSNFIFSSRPPKNLAAASYGSERGPPGSALELLIGAGRSRVRRPGRSFPRGNLRAGPYRPGLGARGELGRGVFAGLGRARRDRRRPRGMAAPRRGAPRGARLGSPRPDAPRPPEGPGHLAGNPPRATRDRCPGPPPASLGLGGVPFGPRAPRLEA